MEDLSVAIVPFDQMNDLNYRAEQEFYKKYPNAGNQADHDDFHSRGATTFYGEKLEDYDILFIGNIIHTEDNKADKFTPDELRE